MVTANGSGIPCVITTLIINHSFIHNQQAALRAEYVHAGRTLFKVRPFKQEVSVVFVTAPHTRTTSQHSTAQHISMHHLQRRVLREWIISFRQHPPQRMVRGLASDICVVIGPTVRIHSTTHTHKYRYLSQSSERNHHQRSAMRSGQTNVTAA